MRCGGACEFMLSQGDVPEDDAEKSEVQTDHFAKLMDDMKGDDDAGECSEGASKTKAVLMWSFAPSLQIILPDWRFNADRVDRSTIFVSPCMCHICLLLLFVT